MLRIETFNNSRGGNAFFKALTHPLAARAMPDLMHRLDGLRVAVYDVEGQADSVAELYPLGGLNLAGCFVQDVAAIGRTVLGRKAQPVTELKDLHAGAVLIVAFDAERAIGHIRHLLPPRAEVLSLDALRLPPHMVPSARRYLDPLNFATNFVFFREQDGLSTRLVSANYWSGYGAQALSLWLLLFDESGKPIAEWEEKVAPGLGSIVIDSAAVRRRFGLPEFTGQLFLHAVGAVGHDIVKYALDIYGSKAGEHSFSCTHDANSWPADYYAGLPAPDASETVTLWIQNSQPCPIPSGAIGLNLMGDQRSYRLDQAIAPFATLALDVASLMPQARWPQQIEIEAGKYMVRPRYEVTARGRRRIAHVNVERTDLRPDPKLAELGKLFGKGFLLPAPILPTGRWQSVVLPTPMARSQAELPIALVVYDASGREIARHAFGRLARNRSIALEIDDVLDARQRDVLAELGGHMELIYDFAAGGEGDGWLHALFRYRDRRSFHAAETSFGAHVFNTVLTYKGEPQSYAGAAPGLSTRLFLRLGTEPNDTLCHLIYPASTPWHQASDTSLILHDGSGAEIARRSLGIPCSGSRFWRYHEMFGPDARARAGANAYIVIRDLSCRLFGYHGVLNAEGGFSLDHMFGF
ncbi:MAG TPA: hypothetical protein VJR47_09835 [Stellaceae bacterium]|nr:hypothetical protein [Stellaceae bacterium]